MIAPMRPSVSSTLAAIAFLAVAARSPAQSPAQSRLTPEGLWQLRRVGEPALRPDGKAILFTVRTVDLAANRSAGKVYLLDLAREGAAPEAVGDGSDPCWTGDGRMAWLGSNGIQVVASPGKDPSAAVPDSKDAANLLPSPKDAHFAWTRDVKVDPDLHDRHPDLPKANARVYDDLMVRHWDQWQDGTYSHLFADGKDLLAGERVDTPMKPFGGKEQFCWSPDGARLCYTTKRVPDPERSTDSGLWIVDLATGKHEAITDGMPGYDQDPAWSPDGRTIAFCSMARAGFESDRVRLFVHDVATKQNTELLPQFDASVHDLHWTADSKALFCTVETQGTTQVYKVVLADRSAVAVTKGRHHLDALQVAPDGQVLYALRDTMERPPELVRIDAATGAITALTDVNRDAFAGLALPAVDAEWFDATDGKKIHAWIVKPPDFDPAKKYPLLLFCQGGPQVMVGQSFSFRWSFHLMAANGYVVAAVNRRGLPGFGAQWNDQISRDWGGQAMQDLLAVTDAMQSRPYIDKAHTAAVGASFGGYSVYWLMGNGGNRFCCMVAHAGVFNLESMYLSTEELWFVDWDLGGPFWRSPETAELYRRFSPHRYVQNWRTPLFVIHGERDFRVPYDQGLQAFTAAQTMGVPSRLLEFPDEGHWILKPQDGVLWQREFFAWLDRWCKRDGKEGAAPPVPAGSSGGR